MDSQPADSYPAPALEDRQPRQDDRDRSVAPSPREARSEAPRGHESRPRVEPGGLDRVLSIPLTLHVELGRKRMRIAEVLELGAGQVLELEVAAGTPLSVFANGTLVAEGEAVVVGDRYGIRITQIVSPEERIARLGGKEVR